jgi:hypothetical protein
VFRAAAVLFVLASTAFAGYLPAGEASAQEPPAPFWLGCTIDPAVVFPGDGATANISLTSRLSDPVLVWAVGIRLDWTAAHEHCYDRNTTMPVALGNGGMGLFRASFTVPPDAAAAGHSCHVCVEYQVNRSGNLVNDTWMSDTFPGLDVVDFTVSVEPVEVAVAAGYSAAVNVSVVGANGFNGSVGLRASTPTAGAPIGCSFSPWNATRPGQPIHLFVTPGPGCADGRYDLSVKGTFHGLGRSAGFSLRVLPPPDFTLNITPAAGRVPAGDHRSFMITVSCHRNLTDAVVLSARSLPAGCTARFYPPVIRPGESARMEVSAADDAPAGPDGRIAVEGRSGRFTADSTVGLVVEPRPFITGAWLFIAPAMIAGAVIAWALARRVRRRRLRGAAP